MPANTVTKFQVVKNLLSYFVTIGDKFGDRNLRNEMGMSSG